PPALLDAPGLVGRRILLLAPRRRAARAAARRIAEGVGDPKLGGTVGIRMRMDTRTSARTRIEVVTEGVLARMLRSDPALEGVGAVLFDEFHERSIHADTGLALALQSRELFRPDLRLLVMSATLDAEPVADLLGGAPVLESEGRAFPVETRFLERPLNGFVEAGVASKVLQALEEAEGDVLAFLPGAGEIRRTARRLEGRLPSRVELHPLSGGLSRARQDEAVAPSPPGKRKVVLATSIAETSLTIEGVRIVVDSGLMRVPRFDPGTGLSRLETVRVTRDAADQRRGRAGRVAPGTCHRLWTRGEDLGLVPHRTPEILSSDLAPLALELAGWGSAPEDLAWLDPPPESGWARARALLEQLGLVDGTGVTERGRAVLELGAHPRLGHMLLEAREQGRARLGAELAAVASERDFLDRPGRAPDADLRLRLEALRRQGTSAPGGHTVHRGGMAQVRKQADRWVRRLGERDARGRPDDPAHAGALAAVAWPDRVARRRSGSRGRFLLRNGRGARFHESQALEGADWIVATELDGRGSEARIFRALPLDEEEVEVLFRHRICTVERMEWDDRAGRVRAIRTRELGAIVLSEAQLPDADPHQVAVALAGGVKSAGLQLLPWTRELEQLRDRLRFLSRAEPDRVPDFSDETLLEELPDWLPPFVPGVRTPRGISSAALEGALRARAPGLSRGELDRLAPTHLEVPSGSRIALDYSDPDAPALGARLQELFGWTETPRVAGGRVPVTIELLSPARRPVQVTRDLASFWANTYFEVRKDLRGRYPKHYWPEDPLTATATRRTRPNR
ncbi:MAG: ATP-dependent helicase HrpB, partial [Gemmatimonadales bacterium]